MSVEPNIDEYIHVPIDQNGEIIKQHLLVAKDFSHLYQKIDAKWNKIEVNKKDNRFRITQNGKKMKMSITQVKRIIQQNMKPDKPIDEEMIPCTRFRNFNICVPTFRKANFIQQKPFPFVYYDYYQDLGKGLIKINETKENLLIDQHEREDLRHVLLDEPLGDNERNHYTSNEFNEEPIELHITLNKKITVIIKDLNVEYNLVKEVDIKELIEVSPNCSIMDHDLHHISFKNRPLYHDKSFHQWYQKMENGWNYIKIDSEITTGIPILDDKCRWKETLMDISHWKHWLEEKETDIDDLKETLRTFKTHDPKKFFEDKIWVNIKSYEGVDFMPFMVYYELPNETDIRGRFYCQYKKTKYSPNSQLYFYYRQLPIIKGKVDVFIDYNYARSVLIDIKKFFIEIFPKDYKEVYEIMKREGIYPQYKSTEIDLWKEEEEELKMSHLGTNPRLIFYPDRPREITINRLMGQEKWKKATFEERDKMVREETLWLMKQNRKTKIFK